MKRYGLVFKIDDQCWLAEYVDGSIEDASPIEDNNGVYTDLNPKELSFVEIVNEGNADDGEIVSLMDLKSITVKSEDDRSIKDILSDGDFPIVAQSIFKVEDL